MGANKLQCVRNKINAGFVSIDSDPFHKGTQEYFTLGKIPFLQKTTQILSINI
jgi:hypothetical protein